MGTFVDIFLCVSAVFLMAVSAAILFGVTAQKRAAERLQNELAALRSELLSGASSGTAEVFSALTQAQQQAWERQDQHLRDFAGQSTAGQAALQGAFDTGKAGAVEIAFSDGAKATFSAYVKRYALGAAKVDGAVGFSVTLRITGKVSYTTT